MALSRERIADELLKLLAIADPSATLVIMLDRKILKPVLPEIDPSCLPAFRDLVAAEREAGAEPDALRRLIALLPRKPEVADAVGARLRLSNRSRKRLVCSADGTVSDPPQALAYRLGSECAVDRLLLAGRPQDAATVAAWQAPRLPVSGGALIKRGLQAGPVVARTLRSIEDRWVAEGFPTGDDFQRIVDEAMRSAR
jgi:poly(A) polymerase